MDAEIYKRKKTGLYGLIIILLFASLIGVIHLLDQSNIPEAAPERLKQSGLTYTYVYFLDCAGGYVKIETGAQRVVSQGRIWDASSAESIRPSQWDRLDGCLVNGVQQDHAAGLVYTVLPREGTIDPRGERHYRIAALKLPNFDLVGEIELKPALDAPPRILLNADNSELFVNYSVSEQSKSKDMQRDVLYRYRVPEFNQAEFLEDVYSPMVAEADPSRGLHISDRSYWADNQIIDRDKVLAHSGRIVRRIDGYRLLTDSIREKFKSLQRIGAEGKKYLDITFADSAGGRVLFVVGWDMRDNPVVGGSGLLVYDVVDRQVLSPILTPYRAAPLVPTNLGTPTAHLTPDGKLVVVEHYEWSLLQEGGQQDNKHERFKTGEIALYDVRAKTLLKTIFLHPQPGFFSRVIGFSPDSRLMYYSSLENIYAVDLAGDRSVQILPISFSPSAIFFSDQ